MSTPINTTVVYHSYKLQAGEQFTLPPNSDLISSSDLSSISSSCDNLDDLEALECYVFDIMFTKSGSDETWSWNETELDGFMIGGLKVDVPMTNGFNIFDSITFAVDADGLANLQATWQLKAPQLFIGDINTKACANTSGGGGPYGVRVSFTFKTTPSVGDNAYIIIHNQWETGANTQAFVKAKKYADVGGATQSGCTVATCPS